MVSDSKIPAKVGKAGQISKELEIKREEARLFK